MFYLLLFVKYLLICSTSEEKILQVKKELIKCFKMRDLDKIKSYVSIEIDYNYKCDSNILTLRQEKYIEYLAEIYNLKDGKLYTTPMKVSLRLKPAEEPKLDLNYRNLIRALLYITTGTKPDIAFSVNYFSRFQNNIDANIIDCFIDANRAVNVC